MTNQLTTTIRAPAWLAFGYIAVLLVFGGGGSPAPLAELVCQALAAVTLVAWVWLGGTRKLEPSRSLAGVIGLIVAVPALQLIPLPPALWHNLPGRELMHEVLTLVGAQDSWRPLSVAPQRTLEALLSLGPPLLAMVLAAGLDSTERAALLKVIAGFALLSVALGAGQLASAGQSPLHFYAGGGQGILFGFQANRNAQVDVILIGVLAAVAAWATFARASTTTACALAATVALLLLGAVLTGSRAGIALIPLTLAWCLALRPWPQPVHSLRWRPQALLVGAIALAGLILAILQTRSVGRVLARFDFSGEYRPDIWRDTMFATSQYWPIGSGLGTFTRVIGPAERLEAIGPFLSNRAHNEYLELLLEAGVVGALAWLLVLGLVGAGWYRCLRQAGSTPLAQTVFSGGTLTIALLHSLVDYPLRSMALAGLTGVAAAFVLAPPRVGVS